MCTILLYIICSHVYPFSYIAADQGRETFALSKYFVILFYVVAWQFTNLKYYPKYIRYRHQADRRRCPNYLLQ